MQAVTFSREPSSRRRRVTLFVLLSLVFCSGYARAQDTQDDVAEAARQERARKAAQQSNTPHVYTNEDLKRAKILSPADQARVEARKKLKNATPGQLNAETRPASAPEEQTQQTESLAEVARRYRAEKAAREEAEAAAKVFLSFPHADPKMTEILAAPKPEIAPLMGNGNVLESPVRKREDIPPLAEPRTANHGSGGRVRISPFQPRPLPARPALPITPVIPVAPAAVPTPRIAPAPALPVAPKEPKKTVAPYADSKPVVRADRPPIANDAARPVGSEATHTIQVQRGDSWWKLARRYMGSGARWPELRSLNPGASEPAEALRQGSFIFVPQSTAVRTAPLRRVVVEKGDTLWTLARQHLGHANAWRCLASANPEVSDYTRLPIGTTLLLPSGEALSSCRVSAGKLSKP